ncbi:MAG: hypothetical protein ACP5OO_03680 [Chloroflexia bacterium]
MRQWMLFLALGMVVVLIFPSPVAPAEAASPSHPPAVAFPTRPQSDASTQAITQTRPLTGTLRIATLVAGYFNRQVEEILALHAQDIGFGCIAKALFTAMEANVPLEQVLQMRLQGLGWGEIRQSLNLPAGMPHTSLGQIISQGRGRKGAEWTPPGQAKKLGRGRGRP